MDHTLSMILVWSIVSIAVEQAIYFAVWLFNRVPPPSPRQ